MALDNGIGDDNECGVSGFEVLKAVIRPSDEIKTHRLERIETDTIGFDKE